MSVFSVSSGLLTLSTVLLLCEDVCKRVMATEGERVVTTRHNGFFQERVKVTIPPGHVWLAGDNVENSTDSRSYGPVPIGLLQGRVFVKLGPSFFPPFTVVDRQVPPHNSIKRTKHTPVILKSQQTNAPVGQPVDSVSASDSSQEHLPSISKQDHSNYPHDIQSHQPAALIPPVPTLTSSSGNATEDDSTKA